MLLSRKVKSTQKQLAVIGLGRFGLSVCAELREAGAEVLAIDIDENRVNAASAIVNQAIVANCTDEDTVNELKLDEYDMVMVSIGGDINASILTTLVVKEAGAKTVWVKAKDKFHAKILHKIGADYIIMPERDMGIRVARKMLDKHVLDFHELGSGLAMTEIVVDYRLLGQTPSSLSLCKDDDMKIIGFKRGPNIIKDPEPNKSLEIGDVIIIVGPQDKLERKLKDL